MYRVYDSGLHTVMIRASHENSHDSDVPGVEPDFAIRVEDESFSCFLRHLIVAMLRNVVARLRIKFITT
jgi:hypothetical protein